MRRALRTTPTEAGVRSRRVVRSRLRRRPSRLGARGRHISGGENRRQSPLRSSSSFTRSGESVAQVAGGAPHKRHFPGKQLTFSGEPLEFPGKAVNFPGKPLSVFGARDGGGGAARLDDGRGGELCVRCGKRGGVLGDGADHDRDGRGRLLPGLVPQQRTGKEADRLRSL